MRRIALALTGAAAVIAPTVAHAQSGPLSSIFQCNNPNNRQGTGAAIGGVLGGILGNQVAGGDSSDKTIGTVLGAAVGAGIGSYVGCNMNATDTSRAETAARTALNENRNTTWTNSRTGVSGRITIVDSFYRNDVSGRAPDYPYNDGRYGSGYPYNNAPQSLSAVSFARGVEFPANYQMLNATYRADNRTNVHGGPSLNDRVVGQLRAGETFDVLARTNDRWLLAARNGVAIGYVADWVVNFQSWGATSSNYAYNDGRYGNDRYSNDRYGNDRYGRDRYGRDRYGRYGNGRYDNVNDRQLCRTFDQTVQSRYSQPTTERFTACQDDRGEWIVQS